MKFKLDTEIKPSEWLYIGLVVVLLSLVLKGHEKTAYELIVDCLQAIHLKDTGRP